MSADHTEHEWHLTPSGWISGTQKVYGSAHTMVERPAECVETWVREMTQSYSMAPEVVTWKCIWVAPDYPEEERAVLRAKYPRPSY